MAQPSTSLSADASRANPAARRRAIEQSPSGPNAPHRPGVAGSLPAVGRPAPCREEGSRPLLLGLQQGGATQTREASIPLAPGGGRAAEAADLGRAVCPALALW